MGGRLASVLVAVFALGALIAACGDDNSKSSSYEDKAKAICAESTKKVAELDRENQQGNEEQALKNLTELNQVLADTKRQLGGLEPPADKKAAFERYLATYDKAAASLGDIQAAAESGDGEAAEQASEQLEALDNESSDAAEAAGLGDACNA